MSSSVVDVVPSIKTSRLDSGISYLNGSQVPLVNKKSTSWRTRRTRLEMFLILAVMVFMLLSLIMIIVAAKSNVKDTKTLALSSAKHSAGDVCLSPPCVQAASRIIAALDTTTPPCEDFYQYSCGTWNQQHPIPEDKSGYHVFTEMNDHLQTILRGLLENDGEDLELTSAENAKKLYESCLDTDRINDLDASPLMSLLSDLGGWPVLNPEWDESGFDYIDMMAKLKLYGTSVLLSQWVGVDDRNSSSYIIHFDQARLGLGSRDYYLNVPRNDTKLLAYENYATAIATLLGASLEVARSDMQEVIDFEIALANLTAPPEDRRDIQSIYNKQSVFFLYTNVTSSIDWQRYLHLVFQNVSMSIDRSEEVVLYATEYVRPMIDLVQRTHPRVLANYMIWRFVQSKVSSLSDRFLDVQREFIKVFYGVDHAPARWRTCVSRANFNFRNVLGRMYIEENFKQTALEDSVELIDNLRVAFKSLVTDLPWMDKRTKDVSMDKADAIRGRIGYPESILNNTHLDIEYSQLMMAEEEYFQNMLLILNTKVRDNMKRLRKSVNKEGWFMPPAMVNAYYSPSSNQIVFPAGILQPPFYHPEFPKSLQYGGIGMVIGHEITHGFDDAGRQFDKDGNMRDWWSEDVVSEFKKKAQCFIDQYGNYTVPEVDMNINGKNTQGENIADNGGLKQAYKAYKDWVSRQDHQEPLLPALELTHDQLFFVNFAQIWCGNEREESLMAGIRSDSHSPGRYRVIGSVANSPDFAKAFNCPVGSPMNPPHKCDLW